MVMQMRQEVHCVIAVVLVQREGEHVDTEQPASVLFSTEAH